MTISLINTTTSQEQEDGNMADLKEDLGSALSEMQYFFKDLTIQDIVSVVEIYPDLKHKRDEYASSDGAYKELLCLEGRLPLDTSDNVAVCVWVSDSHPYTPPTVFVRPTGPMKIKEGSYVAEDGEVDLPYLQEWKHPSSDLPGLLQVLIDTFTEESPVETVDPFPIDQKTDSLPALVDGESLKKARHTTQEHFQQQESITEKLVDENVTLRWELPQRVEAQPSKKHASLPTTPSLTATITELRADLLNKDAENRELLKQVETEFRRFGNLEEAYQQQGRELASVRQQLAETLAENNRLKSELGNKQKQVLTLKEAGERHVALVEETRETLRQTQKEMGLKCAEYAEEKVKEFRVRLRQQTAATVKLRSELKEAEATTKTQKTLHQAEKERLSRTIEEQSRAMQVRRLGELKEGKLSALSKDLSALQAQSKAMKNTISQRDRTIGYLEQELSKLQENAKELKEAHKDVKLKMEAKPQDAPTQVANEEKEVSRQRNLIV